MANKLAGTQSEIAEVTGTATPFVHPGTRLAMVEPPKVTHKGRTSPYLEGADLDAIYAACQQGWVSPVEPVDTVIKARIALKAFRHALAAHTNREASHFAGRTWPEGDKHVIAIALKPGAPAPTESE